MRIWVARSLTAFGSTACAIALQLVAPAAHAGVGGSSESGGTGDTGQTEGTGSTGVGDSTDGSCGSCPPDLGEASIMVRNFEDGQSFAGSILLDLTATPVCECDDCGCYVAAAHEIRVLEGEVQQATCPGTQCVVDVPLPPGPHVLTLVAAYDFQEVTREIQFTILPAPDDGSGSGTATDATSDGGTATAGGTEASGADGGGSGGDASSDGCGCAGAPAPRWGGTALLAMVVGMRRRRGQAVADASACDRA